MPVRARVSFLWLSLLALGACSNMVTGGGNSVPPSHPSGTTVTSAPLGNGPWMAAISSQGLALVGRPLTDSIAVINVDSASVMGSFVVGNRPDDIWFTADGSKAFVTNINDLAVGVVSAATRQQVTTFPTAAHPLRLRLGPGETKLYVTMDNGTVAVLNATTGALLKTLTVGGVPNGITVTPDGARVYVSSTGTGTVTEILTASDALGRSFAAGGTPQDLLAPDNATLWIANEDGFVEVRSLGSLARVDSVTVPFAFGLAVTPDGLQVWVAQAGNGSVTVMDRGTHGIVHSIATGGAPRHLAFTPPGTAALVANESGYAQIIR